MDKQNFEYGRCYTDWAKDKPLKGNFRDNHLAPSRRDFMFGNNQAFVESAFDLLGIPFPSREQIFRGMGHDMVFISSHGIVIRVGVTDIPQLVNPGILQPLGWIEDPEGSDVSVVLYPGIDLSVDQNNFTMTEEEKLERVMIKSGNYTHDVHARNMGVVPLVRKPSLKREKANKCFILLDMDHREGFNQSVKPDILSAKRAMFDTESNFKVDALQNAFNVAMESIEDDMYCREKRYRRAFEYHQPLRRAFWMAFRQGGSNPKKMNLFWQMAKNWKENGYGIHKKSRPFETRYLLTPWNNIERAIKNNCSVFEWLEDKDKTEEISFLAVNETIRQRQSAGILDLIPKENRSYRICKKVVGCEGYLLRDVPIENFTKRQYKKLCEIAVLNNKLALKWVPKKMQTKRLLRLISQKKRLDFR